MIRSVHGLSGNSVSAKRCVGTQTRSHRQAVSWTLSGATYSPCASGVPPRVLMAGSWVVLILACARIDVPSFPELIVPLVDSAYAPFSHNPNISLVTDSVACVIDSYETQVHCAHRAGAATTFGRKGDGPGEYRNPTNILRGPSETIGVIGLQGLSLSDSRGQFVRRIQLPGGFVRPSRGGSSVLNGTKLSGLSRGGRELGWQFVRIDMLTGHVLSTSSYPQEWPEQCRDSISSRSGQVVSGGVPSIGYATPWGGVVFFCHKHLAVSGTGRADLVAISIPSYVDELPNDRDTEDRIRVLKAVQQTAGFTFELEDFRQLPKNWWIRTQSPVYDDMGRTWIGTTRDRDESSYLDVFAGKDFDFLGSVRIRDRLIGYDVLGTTLTTLVERPLVQGEVVARRGIDWYDIGDLLFTAER